ncbi:MAG: M48 family metallopeptidase [Hyphomicrobiales bacterium]|nr:M48 family metallopeptidase [Hyphomicrobiales bacterium]
MSLLSNLLIPAKPTAPKETLIVIDGQHVPVTLRRNRNARRFILRLDKRSDGIVITLPMRASERRALEFAASHAVWISEQLAASANTTGFADGVVVPLRGEDHCIVHQPDVRGTVWVAGDGLKEIHVAGGGDHIARRVADWLKREARHDLIAASTRYADLMGTKFTKVTVRDQSTRWGSCSSNGTLSYSWRLILAPPDVLDYVAAHEVAHLLEMNHGPNFWSLVRTHCPATEQARRWLKKQGKQLHQFG